MPHRSLRRARTTGPILTLPAVAILALVSGLPAVAGEHGMTPAPNRAAVPGGARTPGQAAADPARSVTVPFTLDHNRVIVEVEFVRADGSMRRAQAWVDLGDQYLGLAESLARDLGLDLEGWKEGERLFELTSPAPPLRLGGMPMDLGGVKTRVRVGSLVQPGIFAEANLPASVLRHGCVVLDYPARRFTVARPGVLEPQGTAIPCRVNPETGLLLITATADGDSVQLGVDNGSAGTWVSDTLTTLWKTRHPDWPQARGAVGSTNFFGLPFESQGTLMRLPELGLGSVRVLNVGLLGLDQSLFDWYSKKSAGPVLGFIGANVLKSFRLEVDFPNQTTYWESGPQADSNDLDIVGLTLRPGADSSLTVVGVATKDGNPAVEGVLPGDKLVRVDSLDTAKATMGTAVDALRGKPESTRTLVLDREGKRVTVQARVVRFP